MGYWKPKNLGGSPWGAIQHKVNICRGVKLVSCAGHGGALVAKGWAKKNLSEHALKEVPLWNGTHYAFEEDCKIFILFNEFPEAYEGNNRELKKENIHRSLSRWNPQYLINLGLVPEPDAYNNYLRAKRNEERRNLRDPNLVVAASYIKEKENFLKVWTADGKEHVVTECSYQKAKLNEYNLSDCEVVNF